MIDLDACEGDSFSVVYDIDWFYIRFITINYDRENFLFKKELFTCHLIFCAIIDEKYYKLLYFHRR